MSTTPETKTTEAPPVSRNCAVGNHSRCLGTTHVPGTGLVPCECPADPQGDCGHGTDTYKARRNRR